MNVDEVEDDSWVREFDVSNPQKTHAGYTVYRVSSKVYPKGFPEGASEVIVFKRYSEIRALYKELKIIYESKNIEKKKFPRFAKGHYFDRFDESVIEERQKQALSLLLFAGNISFLFTSQPFVQFFEGGVEHSSRGSSYSNTDESSNTEDTSSETQPPDDMSSETQPPDESSNEIWTAELYFSEKQDSSDDETIYEISRDTSNNELSLKTTDEDDKIWLSHAISLCSEGDDIETLASEAGYNHDHSLNSQEDGEIIESQGSVDMLPTLLESEDEEDVFVEIISPQNTNDSPNNSPGNSEENISSKKLENGYEVSESCLGEETDCSTSHALYYKNITSTLNPDKNHENMLTDENAIASTLKIDDAMVDNTSSSKEDDFQESNIEETMETSPGHKKVSRAVSNIAMSWIDPKKKDYLYQAAQIIQQALYCEANEMYEDAFNKYKICVGILLNGVQHDSDGKRREAVRRKTAQYLVKAEFLFNTYLKNDEIDTKDWSVKPQLSSQDITHHNVVDRQFGHLTLASLKVIGVIGKNTLVQCEGIEGVYVVKALHKTNAVHRSSRQENKQTSKSFLKKYVRSGRMVKLHHHFDTSDTIFLLLQYAAGGCLWNHVKSFRKHFSQGTSDFLDKDSGLRDVPQPNSGALQSTSGVPQSTSNIPQSTSNIPQSTPSVAQPTPGVPQSTPSVDQPTPGVPQTTSGKPPRLNCELDWSVSSIDRNSEVVVKKFGASLVLNKGNSETNYLDSSNELCRVENEPVIVTPSVGKSTSHNLQAGRKTCLNEDKAKQSFNDKDNETGKTCSSSSDNLLGFLDHVSKDYSTMDKCVQYWIAELLLAMNSVHSCGIILKDLKPCNVLLDENGHVKLSYFGVWEEVDHSVDPEAIQQLYCAPEVSRGEKITFVADWWSLGVLSYELITGKTLCSIHPWGIYPHSSIIFPSQDISAEARSFLTGLICHNYRERLGSAMDGVEGIKSHSFFQGVDWSELAKSS